MRFRRKTFRAIIILILVLAVGPLSMLASYYISLRENSIHSLLQSKRIGLTQLSNDKHVLNSYAMRLSHDDQLSDAVKLNSNSQGSWRTPAQQVRIKLTDGIESIAGKNNEISSAVLEWLDNGGRESSDNVDIQKIGLDAMVESIPHAVDLIFSIKEMAAPYPIKTQGCAYERSDEALWVAARCLLILETWDLPFVKNQDKNPASDSSNRQKNPNPNPNLRVDGLREWSIFKQERLVESPLKAEPLMSTKTPAAKKSTPSSRRESKAVINGPAGRLVIHAPSQ